MNLVRLIVLCLLLPLTLVAESGLKVAAMSFNIRLKVAKDGENSWKFRTNMVFDVINKRQPDFVGMQEAWQFQIDAIDKGTSGYAFVGRSREEDQSRGEWCPLFYKKDRFEVMESDTFWLSDTPGKPASKTWGNGIPRICTWALFKEKKSGQLIYIYNTHFDHKSQPSRVKSAQLCREVIGKRGKNAPWIFMGDLNAGEANKAILNLTSKGTDQMVDTYRVLHAGEKNAGTFNHWKGSKDGNKIDYVYVSKSETPKVLKAEIIYDHNSEGRYPSDHYPVWAVLEF